MLRSLLAALLLLVPANAGMFSPGVIGYGSSVTLHTFAVIAQGSSSAAYSDDGITWTAATLPASQTWNSIAWSPSGSVYVAVSQDGTNRFAWSADGATWTAGTNPATSKVWFSVACSPTVCVAVSNGSGTAEAATSTDGKTWTNVNTNSFNGCSGSRCIAWSPSLSLFVVASNGGSSWQKSTDGTTWAADTGCVAGLGTAIAWSPSIPIFAAIGSGAGGNACSSTNGTSWTSRSFSHAGAGMTWSTTFSKFIACGNTTVGCTSSTNGTSWTDFSTGRADNYNGVACSATAATCVTMFNNTGTGANQFYYTTNGTSWTSAAAPSDKAWFDVAASK